MAAPPPNPTTTSNILSTHRALLDTLTSFLTICTHHVLYLRRIYPPVSFVATRAYNYPVRQNRHPAVCTWINDAIAAVRDQFEKNTVEKVCLCIYECDRNQVLERWTFDLRSFPSVAKRDRDVPFESSDAVAAATDNLSTKLNVADLEANFRATLSRISTASSKLKPLPEGDNEPDCSFTITIEVKDKADRPVGRLDREERKWVASEPESFSSPGPATSVERPTSEPPAAKQTATNNNAESHNNEPPSSSLTSTMTLSSLNDTEKNPAPPKPVPQTHAIRRLEAGELRMEVWVEESAAKAEYSSSSTSSNPRYRTAAERMADVSYGAGKEKFNPIHGYDDVEGNDLNRKPQGGAQTDYQRH